jgi:hypothetical protein
VGEAKQLIRDAIRRERDDARAAGA